MPFYYAVTQDGEISRASNPSYKLNVTREKTGIYTVDYSDMSFGAAPFVFVTTDTTENGSDSSTRSASIKNSNVNKLTLSIKTMDGSTTDSAFHICLEE